MEIEPKIVLEFEHPIVIVGGGEPDIALIRTFAERGYGLIGADGGADIIVGMGLQPDAVIGDLDSLKCANALASHVKVLRIREQLSTDFEKCLYSTRAPMTFAVGVTGRRLDHTLASLHMLTVYGGARRVMLIDVMDMALSLCGEIEFNAQVGERVSLYPLGKVRFFTSQGLLYPLDGLEMAAEGLIGTSNEADDAHVRIVPEADNKAPYLLILEKSNWKQFV